MDWLRFGTLLLLAVAMGAGAYFGGWLPMKLTNFSKINYFLSFGMGVLIGTSLILIIPEGIEVMYESLKIDEQESAPFYIGISLLLGFLVMFIQENLPMIINAINPNVKFDYTNLTGDDEPSLKQCVLSIFQSALTLGLVLHAFIDGISLGSSFALKDSSFGFIFFIIIIIHKIPTSFSFTSILIKQGLNLKLVQFHLIAFAIMTPLGAILTYLIISIFNSKNQFPIAILFLFSAGTFLYVIHNVMSEIALRKGSTTDVEEGSTPQTNSLNLTEFGLTLGGALIPIVLSLMGGE